VAYTVIRRYKVDRRSLDEVVDRARDRFIPRISDAPGFLSYSILRDDDDGDVVSISTFESRVQAEDSVRIAASWVREHLGPLLPTPPEVIGGEVGFRRIGPEATEARFGVMRLYRGVENLDEVARRVEAGLVPILAALPGFGAYSVLDAGGGTVISLSSFRDRDAAERSNREAAGWVRANLASLVPNPPTVSTGEILGARFRAP
jgi:heme-degrading monooxygenase HmoA